MSASMPTPDERRNLRISAGSAFSIRMSLPRRGVLRRILPYVVSAVALIGPYVHNIVESNSPNGVHAPASVSSVQNPPENR